MERIAAAWDYFWRVSANISDGLGVTLGLFALTLLFSIPLGLIISLGAISRFKPIAWLVKFYIWLLRGTPLLLQLLFVYFGLPLLFGLNIDNFAAAVIAFVLNYAAYFAEIFRAGIQSIDKGQFEAAKALGLSSGQTMWRVVIPQTISRILPPVGNESITLVKDTSLVSIIALSDIMHQTRTIVMREASVAAFVVAAVFYLVMTFVLTKLFDYLEKRFSKSERFEN
ncbi:MAG TPA: amino acid ABC transporter permease [Candidatus Aphodoplasma excrementigallinarum]|uniref:Amino acid ABC transporter permease n=1 Tax=Candidatus Aphodoplasma excrementigallinarum TaxID=2840673 RepID=A0A9D1NH65_9FIRM|nr:amino acid ABC transporter permease [Candidatus Aphodoplasma excrementigallinarum]